MLNVGARRVQFGGELELDEEFAGKMEHAGGADAKALGVEAGPRLGALLKAVEQYWIDQDFKPDRAELLARLKDVASKER